ncbi:MAG TPA: TRAP transporter large permease [Caulobacterales bacterium]|jgi:tripartite ATP-independent transporter DctM subunit|nr:TRAP transporter large permease [Caulobacterales bacterium]
MTPELIGGLGVIALLVLLMAGVRIGMALGVVGMVGLAVLISPEAALIKAGVIAFDLASRYELGVLPLFLFMAHLCFAAGASRDFYDASAKFLGHRPGGLALASIGACAGFGAISGSSLATVATIGLVALPEMRRQNYSPALATGAIAAGGSIGSLVPPSAALIVFGILAEQSIGRLFTAAIIPAITQALFYMAVILIVCTIKPSMGPASPRAPWSERFASLGRLWDISLLILLVIGGIALGWFSPTEAASVGGVGALLLCARRGKLTLDAVITAIKETLRTTGMIYVVIIGAIVFSTFIAAAGIAANVAELISSLHAPPLAVVAIMVLIILALGMFLDGLALMTLTIPIFLPITESMGLSSIWFGVVLVRAMEIGFVHPPVGMNVYIIHSLAKDIPLMTIFKGIVPFLISDLIHLTLLVLFPAIILYLPSLLGT